MLVFIAVRLFAALTAALVCTSMQTSYFRSQVTNSLQLEISSCNRPTSGSFILNEL